MLSDRERGLTLTTTSRNNNTLENQQEEDEGSPIIRDIHALTPPRAPPRGNIPRREAWETNSQRSSSLSTGNSSEINFSTMSREFSALVLAGSTIGTEQYETGIINNLERIQEDNIEEEVERNPLAIVPDNSPLGLVQSPRDGTTTTSRTSSGTGLTLGNVNMNVDPIHRVKKEEVDSKISAWQNAKISKVNNRFKREDAVINGWESEQVQKATSWMKKVERKLEEKRAKALEKMQNDIAKARRKAEERKASAEAKRGTKVARILEIANLMKAVGRPPVKRSFF